MIQLPAFPGNNHEHLSETVEKTVTDREVLLGRFSTVIRARFNAETAGAGAVERLRSAQYANSMDQLTGSQSESDTDLVREEQGLDAEDIRARIAQAHDFNLET